MDKRQWIVSIETGWGLLEKVTNYLTEEEICIICDQKGWRYRPYYRGKSKVAK